MAVTSMRLVNITGPLSRLDSVLDACSRGEMFQFEQAMSFFGDKSDFAPINDENPYSALYNRLNTALNEARLTPAEDDGGEIKLAWHETESYINGFISGLGELNSARSTIEEEQKRLSLELEQLRHFDQIDIELGEIYDCEYIKLRFGRLPKESYNKLKYYSEDPYVMLIPCSEDSRWVWGIYFAPIEQAADVDRVFQSLMWERLHLPHARGTAAAECRAMEERIKELDSYITNADDALNSFWEEHCELCSNLLHVLQRLNDSFELRRYVARYKSGERFFLAGWVTEKDAAAFAERFEGMDNVDCEIDTPETAEDHEPPVKLKNARFAKPFEFYVGMYGLPSYGEIDPTPFVAITYFLLFGMMFADVGQGLLLSLVGWFIMWKRMKNELGRIITLCGISSMFFGVILGSVFGFEHWLEGFWEWVHAKTGIPINDGKLINVNDSDFIIPLIYATIGIGAVLVLCAMMLNIYSKIKQQMWGEALFGANGVAGFVFYGAVIFAAVQMLLFKNSGILSPLYIICLIVIPLLLIFAREPLGELVEGKEHWLPENIVDFIMQNFFELFEIILSYVSNTVSFLRVGAFMLVHAGMMTVVFTLAEMSPVGSPVYIIVVIIGNIIITTLEGLLVGIQALRLEFYEMFSRFYTGSGRPFTPVGSEKRLADR